MKDCTCMMTLLSVLPIIILLACLIFIKLPVGKSGIISLAAATVIALVFFGLPAFGLAVAVGKALALALFVSLIVWGALFIYHLVDDFKAIDVINKNILVFIEDKFVQFVLLSWLFTGLMQGMAGFGVPIVITAPILVALGFDKVKSLSAVLLGHSWAVTFGSMGAAFFIIQMITGLPAEDLGLPMWVFNTIAHLVTGVGVCWLYDGIKGIRKGLAYILPVSVVMAVVQYFTIHFGMYSLATLNTALVGLVAMFLLYKLRSKPREQKPGIYSGRLNLLQAVLPYSFILVLSLAVSFLPFALRDISLSFNFPGFQTDLGYIVRPETGYSAIRLFGHPAVVLLLAAAVAVVVFKSAGVWDSAVFRGAVKKTVKKGIPATIALLSLGNMSLIMMDSGMTHLLANNTADFVGGLYPFFAPFFGVLGAFLTGNNTNANVLFGSFQYTIAQQLGVSGAVMSAVQSIAGSVGVAIGPTLVLMGTLATKQEGQEAQIYKKVIAFVLIAALAMGIANFAIMQSGALVW